MHDRYIDAKIQEKVESVGKKQCQLVTSLFQSLEN